MKNRFYSFEKGNWYFIILDNIHIGQGNKGYTARLDDDQFNWLGNELENVPKGKFVCKLSHIPIMTVCAFYDKSSVKEYNFDIGAGWQNIDSMKLKDLFYKHKNVKLCISVHEHMLDTLIILEPPIYAMVLFRAIGGMEFTRSFHRHIPSLIYLMTALLTESLFHIKQIKLDCQVSAIK